MAVILQPFAGIANLVNATSAGAKTELQAGVDKILALIADPAVGKAASVFPEFDEISPIAARQIRIELTAFKAAIAAGA